MGHERKRGMTSPFSLSLDSTEGACLPWIAPFLVGAPDFHSASDLCTCSAALFSSAAVGLWRETLLISSGMRFLGIHTAPFHLRTGVLLQPNDHPVSHEEKAYARHYQAAANHRSSAGRAA